MLTIEQVRGLITLVVDLYPQYVKGFWPERYWKANRASYAIKCNWPKSPAIFVHRVKIALEAA